MDELPKLRLDLCPAPLEQEQDDDDESVEVASYNGLTLCEGDVLGVLDDISTDEDEDKSIDCNNTDIESVAPLPIDIKSDEYDLSPTDQQIINNNELSSQRSNKSRSSYYKRRKGREHVHIPILSSLSNRKVCVCTVLEHLGDFATLFDFVFICKPYVLTIKDIFTSLFTHFSGVYQS